ncbi:group II intron reverse transcriptase/maturase [Agrobacterium sp.]|uniref:group II intron reverse transcriptase/maturase n=1 Tax=Agrobacterium sp. TaxID=361 RepID=UPI0040340A83
MPDIERLTNRFRIKNYINNDGFPLSLGYLTTQPIHEIIRKYNHFMLGLGNYYITEIDRTSSLNRWHYILYFSCLKTLAHKLRISLRKVIRKFGYLDISDKNRKSNPKYTKTAYNRRIIVSLQKKDEEIKFFVLHNYHEFMMNITKLRNKHRYSTTPSDVYNTRSIDFNYLRKAN